MDTPGFSDPFDIPLPSIPFDTPGFSNPSDYPGFFNPFDTPGFSDPFDIPGPSNAFDTPGFSDPFDIPGPSNAFDTPGPSNAFDIPGPSNPSDSRGFSNPFDIPGPSNPSDIPGLPNPSATPAKTKKPRGRSTRPPNPSATPAKIKKPRGRATRPPDVSKAGCEHLALHMYASRQAYDKFCERFHKIQKLIRIAPGDLLQTITVPDQPLVHAYGTWTCVQCLEIATEEFAVQHFKQRKHMFFVDTQKGFLNCMACEDIIFDPKLDNIRHRTKLYEERKLYGPAYETTS